MLPQNFFEIGIFRFVPPDLKAYCSRNPYPAALYYSSYVEVLSTMHTKGVALLSLSKMLRVITSSPSMSVYSFSALGTVLYRCIHSRMVHVRATNVVLVHLVPFFLSI